MAEQVIDSTVVDGMTFELKAKDGVTATLQDVVKYLDATMKAFVKAGSSADNAFSTAKYNLEVLRNLGRVTTETYESVSKAMAQVQRKGKLESIAHNIGQGGPWNRVKGLVLGAGQKIGERLQVTKADEAKIKVMDEFAIKSAKAYAALRTLTYPFQRFRRFTEELRRTNQQFDLMARSAMMAAEKLSAAGAVMAGFGGNANSFGSFSRNFEMEMERRRIGTGDGGRFTQVLMRYGIDYDPTSRERTWRNIVNFMADPRRTESQRQQAGAMLGLDQAAIAAASRGWGFWQRQQRENEEMTGNKGAATKSARELTIATEKLALAWQNIKDGVFVPIADIAIPLIKSCTAVLKLLGTAMENCWVKIGVLAGAITILVTTSTWAWNRTKFHLKSFFSSLIGLSAALKAAAKAAEEEALAEAAKATAQKTATAATKATTAVNTATAVAGTAGKVATTVAGTAGGAMGAMAGGHPAVGIINVATGLAGVIQRIGMQLSLAALEKEVIQWHNDWSVFTLGRGKGYATREGYNKLVKETGTELFAAAGLRMQKTTGFELAELRRIAEAVDKTGFASSTINNTKTLTVNIERIMVGRDAPPKEGEGDGKGDAEKAFEAKVRSIVLNSFQELLD